MILERRILSHHFFFKRIRKKGELVTHVFPLANFYSHDRFTGQIGESIARHVERYNDRIMEGGSLECFSASSGRDFLVAAWISARCSSFRFHISRTRSIRFSMNGTLLASWWFIIRQNWSIFRIRPRNNNKCELIAYFVWKIWEIYSISYTSTWKRDRIGKIVLLVQILKFYPYFSRRKRKLEKFESENIEIFK